MDAARRQHRRRMDVDDQRAGARDAPKRTEQRHIIDIGRKHRHFARGRPITECDWLDVAVRIDDRLQERALERKQIGSVATSSVSTR